MIIINNNNATINILSYFNGHSYFWAGILFKAGGFGWCHNCQQDRSCDSTRDGQAVPRNKVGDKETNKSKWSVSEASAEQNV